MNERPNRWQVITARYKGRCAACIGVINTGRKCEWNPKLRKIRHIKCKKTSKAKNNLSAYRPARGRVRHYRF